MAAIDIGKAPKNSAVLPFYGTAALFFVLLTVALLFSAKRLMGGYFEFHLLAIVHMAALGWGTMLIFGACYQLLPVICEKNLYSERLAFISYLLLVTGVVLLVISFWRASTSPFSKAGIIGGICILSAAILLFINVLRTAKVCQRYSVQKVFILTATLWLVLTAFIGVLLAFDLRMPFFTHNHLDILKLHAHAGLAGWFLGLIIGISVKLIPMFLLGKSTKNGLLKSAYILLNVGLLSFLIDGYLFGIQPRDLIYFLMVVLAISLWLLYLADVYKHRIKRPVDTSLRFTALSFANLILALLIVPLLLFQPPGSKWPTLYIVLLLIGWISSIALGMTFKTLPFIVWNDHYKALNGKGKIPMPRQLYKENLLKYQFILFIVSLYLLVFAIMIQQLYIIRIALVGLAFTALIYVINVAFILTHKTKFIHGNTGK